MTLEGRAPYLVAWSSMVADVALLAPASRLLPLAAKRQIVLSPAEGDRP
jgi:hypothetical protein